ncbi:MAG: Type phosphodiesterase/nucleotide pyrophosphatase [Pedosphaera sp.]|nr:Type phosphodiesterase/nucleotide pyrophosphatase [Pedosphaera sp.]
MTVFVRCQVVVAAVFTFVLSAVAGPRAEHVFIISIDGGKPAVMEHCKMPVLEKMVADGAHTWTANTIFPSKTLPSHTSMLTGVGPDMHKILWNDWVPTNGVVHVTTVFAEAKKAGHSTAMFVGKEKFRHLLLPDSVDQFDYNRAASGEVVKTATGGTKVEKEGTVFAKTVAKNAATYIVKNKPELCFIHLTDPDAAGHQYGWGSPQQIQALAKTDAALGVILKAIRKAGIAEQSVILISADHGGHNRGHGTNIPEDMNIPWIAWGKGVKQNFLITVPVTTYDTAATALWLLDVPRPASFDGQPVTSAFE